MKPILVDLPMPVTTPRLTLRPPQPGDGAELNRAIIESFDDLNKWMPWATEKPSLDDSEENIRRAHGTLRRDSAHANATDLRDTLVWSRIDLNGLPDLEVSW